MSSLDEDDGLTDEGRAKQALIMSMELIRADIREAAYGRLSHPVYLPTWEKVLWSK